jgi:photosystem II stability/assembly factor-like uncharacterized protein
MQPSRRFRRAAFVAIIVMSVCALTLAQDAQRQGRRNQRPSQAPVASSQPSSAAQAGAASQTPAKTPEEKYFNAVTWRQIGPFRGGRVLAVTGVPSQPKTFYFGSVAGGVWKSTDGGVQWAPIFDKEKSVSSIGSLAVAESDPNVIYVGSGEACIRGNIVAGNGVYKSIDAGKTWQKIGLDDTQSIGAVIVHPKDPNIVFVAALGHVYGTNAERGVFRSTDGGKTWQKVLYKDDKTGAIDVVFDPQNPNTLFAALWEAHRSPWELVSGGPGSGLYKSTDGGTTWKQIKGNGLPTGILGRIGVSVSGANSNRVYALVEAADGGLFRSDDGGDHWRKMNDERRILQRAWYYMHIFADPKEENKVYVLNTSMMRSTDGGAHFTVIPAPHGDHHGLWIDPNDTDRMINSNDGGADVSTDGGKTWTSQDNQPTAQFYHVIADNRFPYWIYGAQQDNSTVGIATRGSGGGIGASDWYSVAGGESGYIAPYPADPLITYGGSYGGYLAKQDKHTGQTQMVNPWPDNPMGYGAADIKYRFQWTYPIIISPHDPNTIYAAAQVLFKSTNAGQSWTIISPDLTRNDKSKQQSSGGPITKDNTSVEYFDTIFSVAESPKQAGLIWAGTDDGLVQITRDGGQHWENVTPKDMPEWGTVNMVEASPSNAGTAYVAVDKHQLDDWAPYIFKTTDFGKTWTKITNGIPNGEILHVVREDLVRPDLLFAGTEKAFYVSFDGGQSWHNWLQKNLPPSPVHDLIVHGNDVVVATHGRAFWALDDISQIRDFHPSIPNEDAQLLKPSPAIRVRGGGFGGGGGGARNVGQNPPTGAIVYYFLKTGAQRGEGGAGANGGGENASAAAGPEGAQPEGTQDRCGPGGRARAPEITLDITDAQGKLVRHLSSIPKPEVQSVEEFEEPEEARGRFRPDLLPAQEGMNRFVWNLRYEDATRIPNSPIWGGSTTGPMVLPGTYTLKLTVAGKSYTQPLEVKVDPRVKVNDADLQKQFALAIQIHELLSRTHDAINQIRNVRRQIQDVQRRTAGTKAAAPIRTAARELDQKMTPIEEELVQVKSRASEDPLNYPIKLNNRLAALASIVESADAAPTEQDQKFFDELKPQIEAQVAKWDQVLKTDVPAFNNAVKQQDVPAVDPNQKPGTGGPGRAPAM